MKGSVQPRPCPNCGVRNPKLRLRFSGPDTAALVCANLTAPGRACGCPIYDVKIKIKETP